MNLYKQFEHEAQGACAFFAGKPQEDNPYDKESESGAWNHWLYGWTNAKAEQDQLTQPCKLFHADAELNVTDGGEITREEAYLRGIWRPRYVVVPIEWRRKKAAGE